MGKVCLVEGERVYKRVGGGGGGVKGCTLKRGVGGGGGAVMEDEAHRLGISFDLEWPL